MKTVLFAVVAGGTVFVRLICKQYSL